MAIGQPRMSKAFKRDVIEAPYSLIKGILSNPMDIEMPKFLHLCTLVRVLWLECYRVVKVSNGASILWQPIALGP